MSLIGLAAMFFGAGGLGVWLARAWMVRENRLRAARTDARREREAELEVEEASTRVTMAIVQKDVALAPALLERIGKLERANEQLTDRLLTVTRRVRKGLDPDDTGVHELEMLEAKLSLLPPPPDGADDEDEIDTTPMKRMPAARRRDT
jgi:hypothetical protein